MHRTKSYDISKHTVWEAYLRVKAAKGAGGVDGQSMEDFEKNLKGNLYKIWNRMSSGSYLPPPVLQVAIPKKSGGHRALGIPTISDRIAQMVVKMKLEPVLEPKFHQDSYGYRPGKSAHQAVELCKRNCWSKDWLIDLDIKGFFDTIDHDLLMRMVRKHTECDWVILYIERWLKAPSQSKDGNVTQRERGTPQGGVISPLLANLYLHHAFDEWMKRDLNRLRFERYADDIIIHVMSDRAARSVLAKVTERFKLFHLELHPEKTKIIYCRDTDRTESDWPHTQFDFLGFTFKRRKTRSKHGNIFDGYLPAISKSAKKEISAEISGWRVHRRVMLDVDELAKMFNPALRGWINYYGKFSPHELNRVCWQFDQYLFLRYTSQVPARRLLG
jgi:group II intron reverse transcriptase/maturase